MRLEDGTAADRSGTVGRTGTSVLNPLVGRPFDLNAGPPDWEMAKRIHYLIHLGCIEIRNLAGDAKYLERIFDMSDILENLPSFLERWDGLAFESIQRMFREYEEKYPDRHGRFAPFLDEYPIHSWF